MGLGAYRARSLAAGFSNVLAVENNDFFSVENPCVGGSIPPRATKNLNSPLIGLFSFEAWQGWMPLSSDIPNKNCLLKGHVN